MSTQSWLLPEGVDELLAPDSLRLEQLRRVTLDLFSTWGYELVIPPFMDYVDSLLTGTGGDLDLQTFKVIDQLSGKMMGLRADMTPQIARIDAHRLNSDLPTRLCYVGTVVHAVGGAQGGTRIPMQVGAELYGHAGIESDCEVCCLMLDCLVAADVAQVHLDLGHVGVFRSLTRQAGLDAGAETILHTALQRKAADEILAATRAARVDAKWEAMLTELAGLHGGEETIATARVALSRAGPAVNECIDQLEKLAEAIRLRNPHVPVHFDFAELRGYNYHTGVLFSALVPGVGSEVARGGRYDEIGNIFGRARPATGFSTDLKQLMMLSEPDSAADANGAGSAILAPWSDEPELLQEVDRLRKIGRRVIMVLPGQVPGKGQDGASSVLKKVDGIWTAVERTS